MAKRRMFSNEIIDNDAFMDLPLSAKALYFMLGMKADDDGFVNNANTIVRMIGASADDLGLLMLKRFVFRFETGICVILDWKINNQIRQDRYTPTLYQNELKLIAEDENKSYKINNLTNGNQMATNGEQLVATVKVREVKLSSAKLSSKNKAQKTADALFAVVYSSTSNPALQESIKEFIEHRKNIKSPISELGLKKLITELDKLANGDDQTKIAIIDQSIVSGWKGVFPLKQTSAIYKSQANNKPKGPYSNPLANLMWLEEQEEAQHANQRNENVIDCN